MTISGSLFETTGQSVLAGAAVWISSLLSGSAATTLGIIVVAFTGFALLPGRFQLRPAAHAILGLFLLFGAAGFARTLIGLVSQGSPNSAMLASTTIAPAPSTTPSQPSFDPYAGPSLPMQ